MGARSDPGRQDLSTWRTVIAAGLVGVVVLWAWLNKRGTAAVYPIPVLQAEGLLLTALVFATGFAEQGLRRTLEQSLKDERERQRAILERFADDESPVSSAQLYVFAGSLAEDVANTAAINGAQSGRLAAFARRFRRLPAIEQSRADDMLAIALFQDPTEDKKTRSRAEKSLRRNDEEWRSLMSESGLHGHDAVAGLARVGAGSAYAAFSFANTFIVVMIGLFLLGGVYAGWGWTDMLDPEIEFWIGITPIGLAVAYVQLLKTDIDVQLARFAGQLRGLPLAQLHLMEGALTVRSRTVEHDVRAQPMQDLWGSEIWWRLDRLEHDTSNLPWAQSLRGRMHLGLALATQDAADRTPVCRGDLDQAESYLRRAARRQDDPVALIALARCLEAKNQGVSREACKLVTAANREIRRRAGIMATSASVDDPFGRVNAAHGWKRSQDIIATQQWLWPQNPKLRASIHDALQ